MAGRTTSKQSARDAAALAKQAQLEAATTRLEKAATTQPRGVGALTSQVLEREILSWDRFKNRRQVASLTGMCPGVRASGNTQHTGPITDIRGISWLGGG